MQIAIPSLRRGRHVFESTVAPAAYPEAVQQSGVTFRGDIRVRAVMHKIQEEVFVQVEADIWGIGKLLDTVAYLDQIAGVPGAAVLWNREVLIHAKWVPGLV